MSKLIAYHYTNSQKLHSMKTGSGYGQKGLLPIRRFFASNGEIASIEALLEPEPTSWTQNKKYPHLFANLMKCIRGEVVLVSFEVFPEDDAYVLERAYHEDQMYKEIFEGRKPARYELESANWKCQTSMIPALEYDGSYDLPQFAIFSPIEF